MASGDCEPGSSPRTRGTRGPGGIRSGDVGLIPADAGNTQLVCCVPGRLRAHPRGRGEHSTINVSAGQDTGSSPRTRGTPRINGERGLRTGLIPADAGNTPLLANYAGVIGAHPRGRGEHGLGDEPPGCPPGSSPRTRGTRIVSPRSQLPTGLIPADAGNTQLV